MCIAPAPRVTVRFSHADPFNTNHLVSTFQGRLTPFLLIRPSTTPRSPRNFGLDTRAFTTRSSVLPAQRQDSWTMKPASCGTRGSLPPRHCVPTRDVDVTRHQQEFPDSRPIPVLPLTCDRHGWDDGPWAFPWASHPTDQEPDTHATAGTRSNTDPELRLRHPSNLLHELTHNVRLRVATTGTVRIARLNCSRRTLQPMSRSSPRLGRFRCTGMTCSAGCCASTGELHERIYAPYGQ